MILASDGVWEFISSEEAVRICAPYDDANHACRELINESTRRWRREEGNYRDDITAIVVFLPLFPKEGDKATIAVASAEKRDSRSSQGSAHDPGARDKTANGESFPVNGRASPESLPADVSDEDMVDESNFEARRLTIAHEPSQEEAAAMEEMCRAVPEDEEDAAADAAADDAAGEDGGAE
jgi:hypothetical protein